jgi:hypothetical protein
MAGSTFFTYIPIYLKLMLNIYPYLHLYNDSSRFIPPHGTTAPCGPGPLIIEASQSYLDLYCKVILVVHYLISGIIPTFMAWCKFYLYYSAGVIQIQ